MIELISTDLRFAKSGGVFCAGVNLNAGQSFADSHLSHRNEDPSIYCA